MTRLRELCDYMEQFAPLALAEEWDNVGLLVGDESRSVSRVMTCLTVTPASAAEAIRESADLIVTHHPMPFRPVKRLTNDSTVGRLLLDLISAGIAIYSPHTAFDSAERGINQRLAEALHLQEIKPLTPAEDDLGSHLGSGRMGRLDQPITLESAAEGLKGALRLDGLHAVGNLNQTVQAVAVACGAAGEFLPRARQLGCDLLVLGETSFHTCLEAESLGVCLLLPGHFASERFAVEQLAEELQGQFDSLTTWASRDERDPLRWV